MMNNLNGKVTTLRVDINYFFIILSFPNYLTFNFYHPFSAHYSATFSSPFSMNCFDEGFVLLWLAFSWSHSPSHSSRILNMIVWAALWVSGDAPYWGRGLGERCEACRQSMKSRASGWSQTVPMVQKFRCKRPPKMGMKNCTMRRIVDESRAKTPSQ